MGIFDSFFGNTGLVQTSTELPDIFPLSVSKVTFIDNDLKALYEKILIDTVERVQGLPQEKIKHLFDNCIASENSQGLINMLVEAMFHKADLFIVYNPTLDLLRLATVNEKEQIRLDYKKNGSSSAGFYISFHNYKKTDILMLYSALEYCLISALNKTVNLSKAVQIKMGDLRASTALVDSDEVIAQAKTIATSLSNGRDILIDVKDMVETLTPDFSGIDKGMQFLNEKRSFYLGLPASYISGKIATGLSDTGGGDAKAIDRGLKAFYFSIIKPVLEQLFSIETDFKSQDTSGLTQALEALKTFEITEDDLVTRDEKRWVIERLLELDSETNESSI